jgi:hypothetical protein
VGFRCYAVAKISYLPRGTRPTRSTGRDSSQILPATSFWQDLTSRVEAGTVPTSLRAPSHFPARAIVHITLSPHHRDVCVTICLRIQNSYLWPHSLPNGRRENSLHRSSSGLHSPATLPEAEACARRQPSRVKKSDHGYITSFDP